MLNIFSNQLTQCYCYFAILVRGDYDPGDLRHLPKVTQREGFRTRFYPRRSSSLITPPWPWLLPEEGEIQRYSDKCRPVSKKCKVLCKFKWLLQLLQTELLLGERDGQASIALVMLQLGECDGQANTALLMLEVSNRTDTWAESNSAEQFSGRHLEGKKSTFSASPQGPRTYKAPSYVASFPGSSPQRAPPYNCMLFSFCPQTDSSLTVFILWVRKRHNNDISSCPVPTVCGWIFSF